GNLLRFRGGVDTGGFLFTVSGTGDFKVDSAPISGTGGLTKAGGGKLTLGDVNTYSGVTTITGGMLEVQNREALGSTAGGVVVNAGTLALSGHINVGAEALTLNGVGLANSGALRNLAGNNGWAGAVTLGSQSQINADAGTLTLDVASGPAIAGADQNVIFGGAGTIVVADPIATGAGTLEKRDAGTLTLTAASTSTGTTTIAGGTLQLGGGGATGALAPAGAIAIGAGATLAVNRSNALTQGTDFSTAAITGQGGLAQNGVGTLILTAANEYKGATAVNAGGLLVNGDQGQATGAVTVAAGATLGGTGSTGGAVTVGGTLAPGGTAAIESLASGALTFQAGSTFAYAAVDATATGADLMVVNGGLSFGGAATLDLTGANLAGAGWVPGDKLTLISYSGDAVTGGFTGYVDGGVYAFGSNQWRFDYDDTTAGANFAAEAVGPRFVTLSRVTGQTITFGEFAPATYGDAPFLVDASADSGLTLSFVSSDPTVASVAGATVTIHRAGTATITASQAGVGAYLAAADVSRVLTVSAKGITITADALSKTYGDADPALTYLAPGLVGGDTISGALARAAGENVGTYAILQGTLDAGPNYAVSFVGADLSITPKALTVTADAQSKVYGDADPVFTYAASGLVGADAVSGALARAAGENVGTYAILQGTLDAGPNYAVSFVGADLSIT
ncbi:MAG: MBG domain-containing protein, partial [Planctomycetaceae bacterium]